MGKKRTTTTNDPWKPAQPYIIKGMEQTQRVFDQQQPQLDKFSGMAFDNYAKLNPGAIAGIAGSQGLVNDTLGGKYLMGNPYLDNIIAQQTRDIQDGVNSQFTMAGRYGSGAHQGVLAKQIAEASDRLRFQNYGMERQNQINAVGQAQDLMRGSQGLLEQAATLPWTGVSAQVGNIRQASNGYGTTTTTTRDPMGAIMGLAGAGATALSGTNFASDGRLKNDMGVVGMAPDGKTPLRAYTMKDDPTQTPQVGVFAQEVAQTNPAALGPTQPDGTATVNYGVVGMDGPMKVGPDFVGYDTGPKSIADDALKPQSGLSRYLGRVLNPDVNTTAGKVGLFGQALMAASGGPFAPLGQAMLGVGQQQRDEADEQHERAIEARRVAAYEAAAAARNQPDPESPYLWNWQGGAFRYDPLTRQTEVLREPSPMPQFRTVPEGDQSVTYSVAPGEAPAVIGRAPRWQPATGGGGAEAGAPKPGMSGGFPVVTSPAQLAQLPSGATYKAPDGSIRRKR